MSPGSALVVVHEPRRDSDRFGPRIERLRDRRERFPDGARVRVQEEQHVAARRLRALVRRGTEAPVRFVDEDGGVRPRREDGVPAKGAPVIDDDERHGRSVRFHPPARGRERIDRGERVVGVPPGDENDADFLDRLRHPSGTNRGGRRRRAFRLDGRPPAEKSPLSARAERENRDERPDEKWKKRSPSGRDSSRGRGPREGAAAGCA